MFFIQGENFFYDGEKIPTTDTWFDYSTRKKKRLKKLWRSGTICYCGYDTTGAPEDFVLPLLKRLCSGKQFLITLEAVKAHKFSYIDDVTERSCDSLIRYNIEDRYNVKRTFTKNTRMTIIGGAYPLKTD